MHLRTKKLVIPGVISFFYLFFSLHAIPLFARGDKVFFNHITLAEGLSQSSVQCIAKDHQGFMWFGTQEGLNRYDGYQMRVFTSSIQDTSALKDKHIRSLYVDTEGILWIGTLGGGLNRYHPESETFSHWLPEPDNKNSIRHESISAIVRDKNGFIWIGTQAGLDRLNPETGQIDRFEMNAGHAASIGNKDISVLFLDKNGNLWAGTQGSGLFQWITAKQIFIHYPHNPDNPHSLSNDRVNCISEDAAGAIWVGTEYGLNKFTSSNQRFERFLHDPDNPESLVNNRVQSLAIDDGSLLWIGTGGGLSVHNIADGSWTNYINDPADTKSLGDNDILDLFCDPDGIIWAGTRNNGVDWVENKPSNFVHHYMIPGSGTTINSPYIWAFLEFPEDVLWIGTRGGGLNRWDRKTGKYTYFLHNESDPNSLSNDHVRSLYKDSQNVIWIGTMRGLNRMIYSRRTGKFEIANLPQNAALHSALNQDQINVIMEDSKGQLWIGTQNHGLLCLDINRNKAKWYNHDPESESGISHNSIRCIVEDDNGIFWIATQGAGLNRFDPETGRFTAYTADINDPYSLGSNRVLYIMKGNNGLLWIGTVDGLSRFNPATERFIRYTTENGLPNNLIYAMASDSKGMMWISSNKGITRLNPDTEEMKNFNITDGLQSDEFNAAAVYQIERTGEIFFGGINGFNSFFPDRMRINLSEPPVVITDFQLFNKSVSAGQKIHGRTMLEKVINHTSQITLNHKDKVFSFEFAALNYIYPESNQYAYIMEGFESEWNYVGTRRFASYTNLPPGDYVFRVKASNNDGVWNEKGASIKIRILPPFWMTWWFRGGFLLLTGMCVFAWVKFRIHKLETQKKLLESQVKERTIQLQEKNEQILSSIRYAKTIQEAILPLNERISSYFPEHFILYKPRDIVSGDFYWFSHVDGRIYLAVVDCTGHGVPGAFMSMIGNSLLNEIVLDLRVTCPAEILSQLHNGVRKALKQENGHANAQDGMDVCLIMRQLDYPDKIVFAGARRPLYIYKSGETGELIEIKGDRKSIGGRQKEDQRHFTRKLVSVLPGDMIYLSSDGLADQNNLSGKRYSTRKLKNWITSHGHLALTEQCRTLHKSLAAHQGTEPQRDDIAFIGVRIAD